MTKQARTYVLIDRRILPAAVALAAWCPTMDLLALVTSDSQVY
eukprot:COSAG03_NODE_27404_length_253_cov_0.902597_1_plen_42_part_01